MFEIIIPDTGSLEEAASRFIDAFSLRGTTLSSGRGNGLIFAFHAPMGAGKTTFISEVCRQLGSVDEASSPTFSIANEYLTDVGKVYHMDCYRLDGEEEAFEAGIEEYLASGVPCFVEWPEKIGSLIPEDAIRVEIEVMPDGARSLKVFSPPCA